MKKDNHNTVDVNVGAFLRQWIVNTYGTDIIRVYKDSNIWYMIKQHLETLPEDYSPLPCSLMAAELLPMPSQPRSILTGRATE